MTDDIPYTPAQKKALEMGKSLCVTAGAGTGKTFLLTQRYLRLLESGALPRDIVALTYTEKAAAEMQTKIARELKKQAETRPELIESRDTFSQGTISTFHGFCLSILKEFAYEAGLDPGFSVMDELDKTELVEKTIANVLENPPEELFEDVVTLFAYGSAGQLKSVIRSAVSVPKTWFAVLENEPETVRSIWFAAYKEQMREKEVDVDSPFFSLLDTVPEAEYLFSLRDWFLTASRSILERIDKTREWKRKPWQVKYGEIADALSLAKTPEEILRVSIHAGNVKMTIKSTGTFPVSAAEMKTASEFMKIFASFSYLPGKDSTIFTLMRRVLLSVGRTAAYCSEKIDAEKRRAGVLDFDDLLEKTDLLLSESHADILETVSSRYRYLLVDEVQDNDPKLISLVRKLCGNPQENDRLFVVGDAKQSIYLFRGADVTAFIGMMDDFGEEPVALDTNFRSAPEIINLVNVLFAEIFDTKNPRDPKYDALTPFRSSAKGSVTQIRVPYNSDKRVLKQSESETLASWIYDAVTNKKLMVEDKDGTLRPARYSDVVILIEKRKHMAFLRPALDTYHIPYDEASGKDFYTKQESADLFNVLSAVLYPEEDIPLYGALRSPYFSVSDAELEEAAYGERGSLFSRLQRYSVDHPDSRVASSLSSLYRWREYAAFLPPETAVLKILFESEILSVYAGISGGAQMEGNLLKLLDILRSRSAAKPFSLHEFVELLDTSMGAELQEGDGEPADDSGDRIRIMTVHSSKGLEFPVVCVAYAGSGRIDKWQPSVSHKSLGFGTAVSLPDKGSVNVVSALSKDEKDKKDAAEHKRLFYVALTRARDHLVLCGSVETEKGVSAKSFLSLYEKVRLENPPALCTEAVCSPAVLEDMVPYSSFGAVSIPIPQEMEEEVSAVSSAAFALARGTRLHAVFAGEADDAEFVAQYRDFLSCPLMEDVVFEQCELPVVCGGERRVIDRLVQYADGTYAVIDYKTGALSSAKERGLLTEYEGQVADYVELMQEMLQAEMSGWLYFADESEENRILRVI